MRNRLVVRMLILAVWSLGVLNSAAFAAEDKAKTVIIDPIVVTASRAERKLSEVAYSVSVISGEKIKDANAKSVPDLLNSLEGVYMYDSSGVGTDGRINMRGFWGGMSTHQLVLIDGIPQNKGQDKLVDWDLIPLDNIERIEIMRGPGSSLYGDNAMSGIINIITKQPGIVPETKVSASYGDFDTENYKVSTQGGSDRVGYSLGIGRKSTEGFRRHCDYENMYLNGKADFLIDELQDLRFSLDYHEKTRGAYSWAITEAQVAEDRRQARPGTENDSREASKTDTAITYHRDLGQMSYAEGTFYYRYEDGEAFYTSGSSETSTKEQWEEENTFGLAPRLNINPEIMGFTHSFTLGIDLERNNFDYKEYSAPYQVRGGINKDYSVEREKIGPYIQDEIRLRGPVKLIAGIRYDTIEFDFRDYRTAANSKTSDMASTSPNFGMVYTYGEDSNIYANYARAFRTPSLGQLFTYGSFSDPDLSPEEGENYEIGARHRFNDSLKVTLSLYWMDLDNEIWYDSASSKYKNYGQTSHKGIETGLDFKIIKGLTGFSNYTYTRAKNESGDYNGNYLTNIPLHKGSLGLRWEADCGLHANLILTRVGDSYIDSDNQHQLSPYTTVDTKISYDYKSWSAFLAANNLWNETYNSYGFISGGTRKFNPAPERTFTLGVERKF